MLDRLNRWRLVGLVSTLVIVCSLPLYLYINRGSGELQEEQPPQFVGSESCKSCHKREYQQWQKSHHAKAMAVASETSVLGDFNDATFEKDGVITTFFTKDGDFYVHTRGPNGQMDNYRITHTFGYFPLQQYLIPFPGGRMQCLPIAWDSRENKWFHLYPDLELDPEEWIYWTNQGQNWNSMCADCHSTKLQKNYDAHTDSYTTMWAEINVGCESCHGPASEHLKWAELPKMAQKPGEFGLQVYTDGDGRQQVELCAPCHSRRSMLGDYLHKQQDLLETLVPRLLVPGLYHADGQILDEVYVYGSFVQSKMYLNDVGCSDCHNVHSIEPLFTGNDLCLQCHQASVYNSKSHHFHKLEGEEGNDIISADGAVLFKVGSGSSCVQCHMPGKNYMVNDYRPDHSFRIPRPDLSILHNSPNGCNRCHIDKTNEWSAEYTKKWYGIKAKPHYGIPFSLARNGNIRDEELVAIVEDELQPVLVRATALTYLGASASPDLEAFNKALLSDEPLLRRAALTNLPPVSTAERIEIAAPLLRDPVKGVRIEAAMALAVVPQQQLPQRFKEDFDKALAEFKSVAEYSADFAPSRLNLGVLSNYQGNLQEAEKHFIKAIEIDRDFVAARQNLAVIYNQQGKNDLAQEQLEIALELNSELHDIRYSLGLLLAEKKEYNAAVKHLKRAAVGLPDYGRVHYNLGQLLLFLEKIDEAEISLVRATELEPQNVDYLVALVQFYLKTRDLGKARKVASKLQIVDPSNPLGAQLLRFIDKQTAPPRYLQKQ